jgi:hypothetical protein
MHGREDGNEWEFYIVRRRLKLEGVKVHGPCNAIFPKPNTECEASRGVCELFSKRLVLIKTES